MPNRIIKETIRTSRSVNALSDADFRLWVYLITYVDDFGRGSADPELLKGMVFTRRKTVTEKQIHEGIDRLASAGMINLYSVDGEPFLYFPNWADHQRIQQKKSRFPSPDDADPVENTGIHRESPWDTEDDRESPPESESNTNPNPNTESESKRARARADAEARLALFNRFWAEYPKKTAKQDAIRAWAKLKVDEALLQTILTALAQHKESPQWTTRS